MALQRVALVSICAAAALSTAAAAWGLSTSSDERVVPVAAVSSPAPSRSVPTGDPQPAGLRDAHPLPGSVAIVAGPFSDRYSLSSLRLRAGDVTGDLSVTSDVSEVIDLQVLVGFYDASGVLLGTSSYEKHGEAVATAQSVPDERVHFSVTAPSSIAARAVSAAVAVPVLVNE